MREALRDSALVRLVVNTLLARPWNEQGPAHVGWLPRIWTRGIVALPHSGGDVALSAIDVVIAVAGVPVPVGPRVRGCVEAAAPTARVVTGAPLVGAGVGVRDTRAESRPASPTPPVTSMVVASRAIRFTVVPSRGAPPCLASPMRSVEAVVVATDPKFHIDAVGSDVTQLRRLGLTTARSSIRHLQAR